MIQFVFPALAGAAGIILAIAFGILPLGLAIWILMNGKLIAILIAAILGLALVKKLF